MTRIVIVSQRPGFFRGGHQHPGRAEYPVDTFTADQLRQILDEPLLEVQLVNEAGDIIIPAVAQLGELPLPTGSAPDVSAEIPPDGEQAAADASVGGGEGDGQVEAEEEASAEGGDQPAESAAGKGKARRQAAAAKAAG